MKKKRTVWARVEEVLIERRLPATQHYAANLIGLKQPSAALWNKPDGAPSMQNAIDLAGKLGVCVEWLLTEGGPKRPMPPNDPMMDALLQHWNNLEAADKRDLVGYAAIRSHNNNDTPAAKEESA